MKLLRSVLGRAGGGPARSGRTDALAGAGGLSVTLGGRLAGPSGAGGSPAERRLALAERPRSHLRVVRLSLRLLAAPDLAKGAPGRRLPADGRVLGPEVESGSGIDGA